MNCAKNVHDNDKAVQCDLFEQPQSKKKVSGLNFIIWEKQNHASSCEPHKIFRKDTHNKY